MKKTKRLIPIISACFLLIVTQAAEAQTASNADKKAEAAKMIKESTPEQRAMLQTGMMKNKLNLDSAEVVQVQAINLKYAEKLDPVLKGDERKLKQLRDMMAIQKAKDADLKKALTADQYKQYEAMKDEMKEKLKEAKDAKTSKP